MEKINLKLLCLVLEASPSFLTSKVSTRLRTASSKILVASYHDRRSGSWEYDDEEEYSRVRRPRYQSGFQEGYDSRRPRYNSRNDSDYSFKNSGSRRSNFETAGGNLQKPDWNQMKLKPFEKNFYTPTSTVENRSMEEIENFRKQHNLTLKGKIIPNPILEFSDYEFPKEVMKVFMEGGYSSPTPIQAQGWPIALSGLDIIGIGQTGSGKTLGFTAPGLVHIRNQPPMKNDDGPVGLVLAPTRELAQQIHQVADNMFYQATLKTSCLFGGASKMVQMSSLRERPALCVATPGRLLDFLEMGVLNLRRCSYLVVDEADRMLDMGFEPQIRKIVSQIRPDRQTLMWSATWPKDVQQLAHDFLIDPIQLNVGSTELMANPNIKQEVEVCGRFDKRNRFLEKMKTLGRDAKVLIFSQTKVQADIVADLLFQKGFRSASIHGDHSQARRDQTLRGFKEGKFSVLVGTDVAARGIDVSDITHVINYDLPQTIEDYVHRIGRTGRAGKSGISISFVSDSDSAIVIRDLINMLEKGNFEVPSELNDISTQSRGGPSFSRYNSSGSRFNSSGSRFNSSGSGKRFGRF